MTASATLAILVRPMFADLKRVDPPAVSPLDRIDPSSIATERSLFFTPSEIPCQCRVTGVIKVDFTSAAYDEIARLKRSRGNAGCGCWTPIRMRAS